MPLVVHRRAARPRVARSAEFSAGISLRAVSRNALTVPRFEHANESRRRDPSFTADSLRPDEKGF